MSEKTTPGSKPVKTNLVPGTGRIPIPAYHGDKPYIFLSYAHKDAALVFAEILRLNELGYHVWYDEGIAPGNEWTDEIAKALEGCSLFLVMITPASAVSENVQNEINYALDEKKPFLAVHLQETELKGGIRLQIGTKQAILKYNMSDEEYVYKIVSAFDRMGLPSPSGGPKGTAPAQSPADPRPQTQAAADPQLPVQPARSRTLMIAAAVLVLIAAVSIPLLNRQGKEETSAAQEKTAAQETAAAQETSAVQKTPAVQASTGSAAAAANEKGEVVLDGVEYRIYEDHAVVFGYDQELETLEIPSQVNGVPVTEISSYWNITTTGTNLKSVTLPDTLTVITNCAFANCKDLKEIDLPEGVKTIGYMAFYNCASLEEIRLPEALESIESYAFLNCGKLKKVVFNHSLKEAGDYAFGGCTLLKIPALPDTLATMGEGIFNACTSIDKIDLPANVTTIPNYAFQGCSALEEVKMPGNITSIGENAFYACASLKTISFPDSLKGIGKFAFYGCAALKEIYLPHDTEYVGESAFANCYLLETVQLSETLTSIEQELFRNDYSLFEIYIPGSVQSIGIGAFRDCGHLSDVWFNETRAAWESLYVGSDNDALSKAYIHFGK